MYHRKPTFTCENCNSTSFFEDDDGTFSCKICFTKTLNFIKETNDVEDGAIITQSGGRYRNTYVKKAKIIKKSIQEELPDLKDFLSIYQSCIQILIYSSLKIIKLSYKDNEKLINGQDFDSFSQLYTNTMKDLWQKYLKKWLQCKSECNISYAFSNISVNGNTCLCKMDERNHPFFPTKPLLLGFLALNIRILRLDILPTDICKWIERGLIPYSNIWEALPDDVRNKVPKKYKFILNRNHKDYNNFPSPMNIFFHMENLSIDLDIPLPPLNAPSIAYGIIKSLQLPSHVWVTYVKISQLFTMATPLLGLETIDQHSHEWVMAAVILSCLLSKGWTNWEYQYLYKESKSDYYYFNKNLRDNLNRDSDDEEEVNDEDVPECIPEPQSLEDLNQLPRHQLFKFISQIRRILPTMKTTQAESFNEDYNLFNNAMDSFLNKTFFNIEKEDENNDNNDTDYELSQGKKSNTERFQFLNSELSKTLKLNKVFYTNNLIFNKNLSKAEKNYFKKLNPDIINLNSTSKLTNFSAFISYSNSTDDVTGHYIYPYKILLERASLYLYTYPIVLLKLVEKLDAQISQLVFDGDVKEVEESTLNLNHPKLREKKIQEMQINKYKKYKNSVVPPKKINKLEKLKENYDNTLPSIHEASLIENGLTLDSLNKLDTEYLLNILLSDDSDENFIYLDDEIDTKDSLQPTQMTQSSSINSQDFTQFSTFTQDTVENSQSDPISINNNKMKGVISIKVGRKDGYHPQFALLPRSKYLEKKSSTNFDTQNDENYQESDENNFDNDTSAYYTTDHTQVEDEIQPVSAYLSSYLSSNNESEFEENNFLTSTDNYYADSDNDDVFN